MCAPGAEALALPLPAKELFVLFTAGSPCEFLPNNCLVSLTQLFTVGSPCEFLSNNSLVPLALCCSQLSSPVSFTRQFQPVIF